MQQIDLQRAQSRTPSGIWILGPLLDTLFVCGGLLLLVVVTVGGLSTFAGPIKPFVLLLMLSLVVADSHNAATIMRLIEEPGLAKKHVFISFALPVLLLSGAYAAIHDLSLTAMMLKLYLILIVQHVTAQAYGITMIYLRKTKSKLSADDLFSLKAAFTSIMIAGIVRQLTSSATLQAVGINVPSMAVLPNSLFILFTAIAVGATLYALMRLYYSAQAAGENLHPGAAMILFATLSIVTLSGEGSALTLYAPAFFHASQYLAVATAKRNSAHISSPFRLRVWLSGANFDYWYKLACLGIGLYVVVPLTVANFGFSSVLCLAVMFCAINFHHFAADAVIWRSARNG